MKTSLISTLTLLSTIGCYSDVPHEKGQQRPPVDQLDSRDAGLQSKDVVVASEAMANDLLQLPELNASREQWKIVVGKVRNNTSTAREDLSVFLQRLRSNLFKQSGGRITLIQNKDDYYAMQDAELEAGGSRDEFEQGYAPSGGKSAGIQPDYILDVIVSDLPNRGTNYYTFEFQLTNLHSRVMTWTNMYEVKVER